MQAFPVVKSGCSSLIPVHGLLTAGLPLWQSVGSRLADSVAVAPGLGLAALQQVGSFRTRDQTRVPCMADGFLSTVPPAKSCFFILDILIGVY